MRTQLCSRLCSWITPIRCAEPAEIVFESGLGYCRKHAEAVTSNREWLREFFVQWQEARTAQSSAPQNQR
jgi:hypothetical protein